MTRGPAGVSITFTRTACPSTLTERSRLGSVSRSAAVQRTPAVVLWRFRVAAGAVQVGLWATVAIAFGYFAQRALEGAAANENRSPTTV